jgi:SAM-dependent methyltransferase
MSMAPVYAFLFLLGGCRLPQRGRGEGSSKGDVRGCGVTTADASSGAGATPAEPSRTEVLAGRYINNVVLGPLYRRYVDEMDLRGDERVLDYGSGGGAAARHLAARLRPDGHLTCVDVSTRWQETLRKVLRAYPEVELRCGDIRAMCLPGESYDVVLVHWMLHDVPPRDRPAIVAELARLLRPGGHLFSREPTGSRHGMPAMQVRELFAGAGLAETFATKGRAAVLGEYYRAVWTKPAG